MEQRVTTEQLIYKIGTLTLENDFLRAQIEQLQAQLAAHEAQHGQNKENKTK